MGFDAIVTICVILGALILFITEKFSVDIIGILILSVLVLTGVISPKEGVEGFSNSATVTVMFMFILSAALLKTGALQFVAYALSKTFKNNFYLGMFFMMLLVAGIAAFINNTPVVAIFIPVMLQIAHTSGRSASKMLIPLSYITILGGTVTLIGTSTNILVSGIAEKSGLGAFSMFQMTPLGIIYLIFGFAYIMIFGIRMLPDRNGQKDLSEKFGIKDYVTDIEILQDSSSVGKSIMESELIKEFEMDVIEVKRNEQSFTLPPGDFVLEANDVLKVQCGLEKIKSLKDREKIVKSNVKLANDDLKSKNSTLVELIITSNSEIDGQNLREVDFRRRYRAVPLAIKSREDIKHENLYETVLKSGDVVLAEVKNHYVKELKKMENEQDSPFILISEETMTDFNKKDFIITILVLLGVILTASLGIVDIMIGSIAAVAILSILKVISMKEAYDSVSWNIIFLLAGALSLGVAMHNSGLDQMIANLLIDNLGSLGPIAIVSGLYLATFILTELISNNATAALLAPIAIATAHQMGLSPWPFLMAVTFAASASFATPIGYQCNTMVYSAGNYKFADFLKVGLPLNILMWIIASIFIPIFFPF